MRDGSIVEVASKFTYSGRYEMQALRMIRETNDNGEVLLKLPKMFGHKVEIIVIPVKETANAMNEGEKHFGEEIDEEAIFLAAAFDAVTEDDEEEDAVWRNYLQ